ncbi:integrase, catalytic region [Acaryochloris marina MBIC11017]|uniref:Integrase, catalytic region n=2 Tax=Acaryochloris marina TaxID=155978 RepID=B0BYN1_ACAM1|nr:integrase, catalytic region [Acaryochloris marina MBIC11017]BDM80127.1 transposase [Acaryochloris marina MBIC10699]ABW25916.1 integrase, catalytic region [Acaryochloris marina MBIC11017]ABW27414.1 integrase, catalytic region [Acaryochloris marina MBIC11017]ABW27485.1 integrase, catalytic region [Acaryochloris marina MBIC11017]
MVRQLQQDYSIRQICQVLNYPRSQVYYHARGQPDESELKAAIAGVAGAYPTYGYRRITAQLQRQGYCVNHKRVARLMRQIGIMAKTKVKRKRTTNSEHSFPRYGNRVLNLSIDHPEQVWVADITYIRLQQEFVYLAVVMDVFTRAIRGWHLSRHIDQQLTLRALNKALERATPEIHHSDQGVQYAAAAYMQLLQQHQVQISMAEVGQAWQNGYAERLMRTIKEEEVDLSDYRNFTEAYEHIEQFLEDVYMHKRIHSSLGYLTPCEYEQQWRQQNNHYCMNKEDSA